MGAQAVVRRGGRARPPGHRSERTGNHIKIVKKIETFKAFDPETIFSN